MIDAAQREEEGNNAAILSTSMMRGERYVCLFSSLEGLGEAADAGPVWCLHIYSCAPNITHTHRPHLSSPPSLPPTLFQVFPYFIPNHVHLSISISISPFGQREREEEEEKARVLLQQSQFRDH